MSGRPRCPVGRPAVLSPFIIVMVMAVVVAREAVARAASGGGDLDLGGSGSMVVVFFCTIKPSNRVCKIIGTGSRNIYFTMV